MLAFRRLLTFTSSVKCFKNSSFYKLNHCRSQNFCTVYHSVKKHSLPVKTIAVKFHTSRPNNALPPLVWIFVRPVLKLFAILFGRGIRKWWQNLPKNKRKHFLKLMFQRKYSILGSCFAFCGLSCGYYFYHLEEHPITKRKRFIIFSNDQISQLTNLQILLEAETHKDKILPINHPAHRRVQRVVTQLLNGNQDVPEVKEKEWSVTVIDSDVITAFVFLNGHIFVYTGILDTCVNDDQLGVILGHEMAHAILGHVGEKLSNAHVAEMLFIIPLVVLWSVFPDAAAFIFQIISSSLVQLVLQLPYSRSIEREADEVGLQLAAKSCFDVRQASAFWQNMSQIDPLNNEIEFLSSHPSHEHRKEFVEQLIPPALELRRLCKCPNLI